MKKTLEEIMGEDAEIKNAVDNNPNLYDSLLGIHESEYERLRIPIKAYELVDKCDKYLAIAETALRVPGPGQNMLGYVALRGPELIIKGLASLYYGAKTKDWKGVRNLAAMETAATLAPFGEMVNVLPAYKKTAKAMLNSA